MKALKLTLILMLLGVGSAQAATDSKTVNCPAKMNADREKSKQRKSMDAIQTVYGSAKSGSRDSQGSKTSR